MDPSPCNRQQVFPALCCRSSVVHLLAILIKSYSRPTQPSTSAELSELIDPVVTLISQSVLDQPLKPEHATSSSGAQSMAQQKSVCFSHGTRLPLAMSHSSVTRSCLRGFSNLGTPTDESSPPSASSAKANNIADGNAMSRLTEANLRTHDEAIGGGPGQEIGNQVIRTSNLLSFQC